MVLSLLVAGLSVGGAHAAFSAARPAMGWNPYNAHGCTTSTQSVMDDINAFSSLGFLGAGYTIFGMDCGWQATTRPANKSITYDTSAFPNGIAPLSQYAKSKGFLWGMYTDQGIYSCDTRIFNRTGSLNYESQDAAQFKQWGVDYMKVDNCFIDGVNNAPKDPRTDFPSRFGAMSSALKNNGINGMLTCQWGVPYSSSSGLQGPAQWTPGISNSFRVSDDIAQGWSNVMRITNQAINVNLRGLNGPNHWSDMDLLEVGNSGMTADEQASHFAIWAMFKSALFVSTPLQSLSTTAKNVLQNTGLIAINQDSLGKPVVLTQRFSNDNDQFAGPLANGDVAVLLVDQTNTARNLGIQFSALNISSATVTNLWTGQVVNNANNYFTNVAAHGSVPLRLSKIVKSNPAAPTIRYYEAESGQFAGNAGPASCSGCSGGKKAGNIGQGSGNTLTLSFTTSAATQDIRFDYVNGDVQFGGGTNVRTADISINGASPFTVLFPITGYNWDKDVLRSFLVRAYNLKTNGQTNTLTISNANAYAPDFDRIGVIA